MRAKQLLALLLIFVSALTYAQQPATRLITGIVYDLRTDPGETLDVKEKHPEIVNQLSQIADKYRKTIGIG